MYKYKGCTGDDRLDEYYDDISIQEREEKETRKQHLIDELLNAGFSMDEISEKIVNS